MNFVPDNRYTSSLYVGDLHPGITEQLLYSVFSFYGTIVSIKVYHKPSKTRSLKYAFINFLHPTQAKMAMNLLNFEPLLGQPIRIMRWQRDPSSRKSGEGNVFIKNLDKNIDNRSLYDTFSLFGEVLSCKIAMGESGSKGYGFVHFESVNAARNCISKINGMLLNGKKVYACKFLPREQRIQLPTSNKADTSSVYVKNFADSLNDQSLGSLFEKYGPIVSSKVIKDSFGKSRGFGFVRFADEKNAEAAMNELNGKLINGRELHTSRAQTAPQRRFNVERKPFKKPMPVIKKKTSGRCQQLNEKVEHFRNYIGDGRYRFSTYSHIISQKPTSSGDSANGPTFAYFPKTNCPIRCPFVMKKQVNNLKYSREFSGLE